MHADPLLDHLRVSRYGKFTLTDAIRPAFHVPIQPREGYRIEIFRDRNKLLRLPTLAIAASAERLFDTFLTLLEPLGPVVHVVLESSHGEECDHHTDLRRNRIDTAVLASHLCDFEDLLLNDGCTGIAVLSARRPVEVQFDEHKLIHVYSPKLRPFRGLLKEMDIRRRKDLPLISEAEHMHHSSEEYADQFQQLCLRLGVGDFDSVYSE